MIKILDDYDWEEAFTYADFDREDVAEIAGYDEGENDGNDWIIYGRLNDGDWFLLAAWCDYTGWDCQAGGDSFRASTKDDIERMHMTDEHRSRLGIVLD